MKSFTPTKYKKECYFELNVAYNLHNLLTRLQIKMFKHESQFLSNF